MTYGSEYKEFFRQCDSLRRLADPYEELRAATQSWKRVQDACNPYQEVTRAFHTANLAAVTTTMQDAIGPQVARVAEWSAAVPNLGREVLALSSVNDRLFSDLAESLKLSKRLSTEVDAFGEVDSYLKDLAQAKSSFESALGPDFRSVLGCKFGDLITPGLAALRSEMFKPDIGFLTGSEQASLLTWAASGNSGEKPRLTPASFLRDKATAIDPDLIEVVCQVDCRLCDEPMIVDGEDRWLDARRKLIVSLRVIPICPNCAREMAANEDYLEKKLWEILEEVDDTKSPRLRLIHGSGERTSAPRGPRVLRLVKNPEPKED